MGPTSSLGEETCSGRHTVAALLRETPQHSLCAVSCIIVEFNVHYLAIMIRSTTFNTILVRVRRTVPIFFLAFEEKFVLILYK